MLGLFASATRWEKIPHGTGDRGSLKLHDNGSFTIGNATFSNTVLEDMRFGEYAFDFDGKYLSIRGPRGLCRFKYSKGHWFAYNPH